jgi:L,D-transpeptidase ErfK/SrfK
LRLRSTIAAVCLVAGATMPALAQSQPPVVSEQAVEAHGVARPQFEERAPRTLAVHRYEAETAGIGGRTVVGAMTLYQPDPKDTFVDIARDQGLGYGELIAANPGRDPWVLRDGQPVLMPTEWVLPDGPHQGVVMNIPEMRLYFYPPGEGRVYTAPVGLGRQDWKTPVGSFRIRGKTRNPVWVLPESIRKEWKEKNGETAPLSIAGGSPENPLGKFRFELTLPSYAIHGTNKNYGVGMQVSHGCVRMYPEDIESLFPLVPVGTSGAFVYEPVKLGVRDGRILIEVHPDIYDYSGPLLDLARQLIRDHGWEAYVDEDAVEAAVDAAAGVPVDIGGRSGGA